MTAPALPRLRLRPYPVYKDSCVPLLGEIPAHWMICPGFSVLREKRVKNAGLVERTVLSLSYGRIVIKPTEKLHGLVPESFETYQIVDLSEIIIRPTDLQNDWNSLRVGIATHRGIITSAYMCLKTLPPLISEYGYLLLHTYDLKKVFYGMGSGLRQNLDFTDFKRMPIAIPPPEEQSCIYDFVAGVDRRINRLIQAKRRLIALLNEQKQATIHRAVTRGLDPDARLKPSGIDWLGDIPEHWEVRPIKAELQCLNQRRRPLNGPERGAMQSRQYDYYGASGVIDKVDDYIFDDELLLIAEDGANLVLRNLPLAVIARGRFWVNNHAHILKPRSGNLGFFAAVLECVDYLPWISGAAQPKLTKQRLLSIQIPIAPPEEQHRIVLALDSETRYLTEATDRARREIDLLREYRTRLIADVVTGKLDVRGVELPAIEDAVDMGDEGLDLDESEADGLDDDEEEDHVAD